MSETKTKKTKVAKPKVSEENPTKETVKEDLSWVVINPRITEKAAFLSGVFAYTFNISPRANKVQVKKAVKQIYNVNPIKVGIVRQAPRKEVKRGKENHLAGNKKAIVYLKKGEKIEFV